MTIRKLMLGSVQTDFFVIRDVTEVRIQIRQRSNLERFQQIRKFDLI